MMSVVLMSMVLLQLAGSAPATPAGGPVPPESRADSAVASNTPPEDPVVCRRVPVAGSAFDKKECHTLKTWARMARDGY